MVESIFIGISGLLSGLEYLFTEGLQNVIMLFLGGFLLYLGIKKEVEPLLLVPIGFGCILVNLPLSDLMDEGGVIRIFYDMGIMNELFPLLIFVGIGAMTDFGPLLENPKILLLGAAGQFGIFLTLLLALALGFDKLEAVSIGIIGACDGPTAIYVTSQYAPQLLGAVSVAAYSYMSLVPIIQPPIMKVLTTKREKTIRMGVVKKTVSDRTRLFFPLVVTLVTGLIAPKGLPLMGMIMLGNFMKESAVVARLTHASENEIANIVTLFLGLAIGGTMEGHAFLKTQTLAIFGLGFLAICLDTATGVLFGKLMCLLTGGKVNPLIGAAGISAYPMAARVAQVQGQRYDKQNYLLMHAMGANTGGQIGSVMAAAVMLSILKGMGLI
ncbi:MAG: sodium ion-translocating decarboxylase subunit beta [Deltaproteobacteria bacterium]|nr:sodium ion-translocating decarboxylase subunit beta [Deltaproteobacteria bacterium]